MLGGFGAGKTLPVCVLGVLLSLQVPGNIGVVTRRSYPKLRDSTQRAFIEVLERARISYTSREVRDGWPHRIILDDNKSEIFFRETKDLMRFFGAEYGWFVIDEAAEEPRDTFVKLASRLRLPHAKGYLKGILASNPPPATHWIADVFGTAPAVFTKTTENVTTTYELMRVSSRVNPYLPEGYVADLVANNPESEVRRIIEGEYGFVYEGQPVYAPPFSFDKHVRDIKPPHEFSLIRSWDFGYRHHAVTWHQFPQCKAGTVHWLVLHEYCGSNQESEKLAGIVLEETKRNFPALAPRAILDCGDHAGAQVSEKGPGPIVRLARKPYGIRIRHKNLPNIDPGLALVRSALGAQCACGQPVMQIHRTCRTVIDGLAGGYHYPQFKPGANVSDQRQKPVKDDTYDHPMDTIRYAGENFYRALIRDPHAMARLLADQIPGDSNPDAARWDWMDAAVTRKVPA